MARQLDIGRKAFVCSALFLASFTADAVTQPHVREQPQAVHIVRLEGLARAWGAVKYFHPRLAWTGIDWDRSLIDSIPKVNASHNSQEYAVAINSMLSALGDPNTRARVRGNDSMKNSVPALVSGRAPVRLEAGLLIVDEGAAVRLAPSETQGPVDMAAGLLPGAKAILLDLRAASSLDQNDDFARESFLSELLPKLLDHDVILASQRYRVHSGYAPQRGHSSGGYYSGLEIQSPSILVGQSKTETPPIIILVNASSVSLPVIIGLRSAGLAYVVQEGLPPTGRDTTTIDIGDDVELVVSTTEWLDAREGVGFAADEVIPLGQSQAAVQRILASSKRTLQQEVPVVSEKLSSGKEDAYQDMVFPAYEYRMLALFRYWNVINYFYPYKDLIGRDWNDVLGNYIPRFEAASNEYEYEVALRELTAEIHDSHGFMGPTRAFAKRVGAFSLPVALRYIEGQSVVAAVLDSKTPLHVGDVILGIDGQSMASRREYFSRLYSASTSQASMRQVEPFLLRGEKDSQALLTIRGSDGKIRDIHAKRTMDSYSPELITALKRTTPSVAILPGGIGYVDLDRLQNSDVSRMFDVIKTTRATIFDMRGYPNGTAWTIAPRLSKAKNPVAALFSRSALSGSTFGADDTGDLTYQFQQRLPDAHGERYDGQVVMLIDESAGSQAEHTCLFFDAATNVTFVGTPTIGVDGDVTNVVLPGGITASFTGQAVRHPSGLQLQRVGIQPTIRVAPTIAGIAAGRDEILDAALGFLSQQPASKPE